MNVSAIKVLAFLFACLFSVLVFSVVAEKLAGEEGKLCISNNHPSLCLKFFTINDMIGFEEFKSKRYQQVEELRRDSVRETEEKQMVEAANTLLDSINVLNVIADNDSARFWLPENNRNFWSDIFTHWESLKSSKELYRILHHGDSQIEMDRMTAYIRKNLQSRFGGSGPGLLPPLQLIPSYTVQQNSSSTWNRYIAYGLAETRAGHKHYGALGMIFSFDSGYANVNISAMLKKDSLLGKFETVKIITGRTGDPFQISLAARNSKYSTMVIPNGAEQLVKWNLAESPSSVTLSFSGDTTAEVLGIAIDGNYGIAMDNIPWRGSSGTTFTSISKSSLVNTYRLLDVKMVILQFGGNSVPYIRTEKAIIQYVTGFKKQIDHIRSTDSTIKILVIGPADMSYNEKGTMTTYPLLEQLIEEMRKVSNNAGAAYWSLYHAMGGRNSMVRWVNQYPALAAPDYIHFTPRGSETISRVFYNSIEREYEIYMKTKLLHVKP